MAKYSKSKLDKICSLIKEDSFTIAEICVKVNISERSFYEWQTKYAEFADAIKKARDEFSTLLVVEAKRSLMKKLKGYTIQEVKTVNVVTKQVDEEGNPIEKQKERTIIDRHFQPDTAAIIFTLCNRDSDHWKNRQDTNISGEMTLTSDLDKLSDEELENLIRNGGKIEADSEA